MTSQQEIHVRLCERGEFAELSIDACADVDDITVENLSSVVQAAGVAINECVLKRLDKVAVAFAKQPRRITKIIATSIDPVHGKDGYLRWEPRFDRVTKPMAKRQANPGAAKVNHYAGLHYVDVKADDHVATIIAPTEGTDGMDVCGQPIKARAGSKCDIKVEPSLLVDDEGRVISKREGTLQFERKVLRVDDVLTVSGCVDFTTGNIKVNGSVEVREHVRAMFTVNATVDVSVGGLVEAATIICQKNFYCRRGVVAKGRGRLVIGANAEVGYLNDATATVGQHLILHREAIDSEIKVSGDVRAESATIIGGTLCVAGTCVVGTLGSRGSKPTIIQTHGTLKVLRMIHQGVTFRLPGKGSGFVEAVLREQVRGEVQLMRNSDGEWCFVNAQNLTLPLAGIATLTQRKAA